MEEEPPKTPSDYDKLSKRDRAIVDAAIDFLLNEPPENQKRRRVIEGVLQVFRG
jgi:mRNA-degrading endonuclease RelE of RelBE toxin-antitoxin system